MSKIKPKKEEVEFRIEVSSTPPEIPKKTYGAKTLSRRIVEQALQQKEKFITIRGLQKSPTAIARGIGRTISSMKLEDKLKVLGSNPLKKEVYLERLDVRG